MALIRSSLLSDISGSIGGTTYSRARGGAYARNRTVPINPRTALQEANRDLFAATSTFWSSLTSEQLQAWNLTAHAFPLTNRLGETYNPSGRQLFMSCNRNLALIDLPFIVDAPPPEALPPTPPAAPTVTVQSDATDITVFTADVGSDGGGDTSLKAVFKFTQPMAPARGQSYRNILRGPWDGTNNYIFPTGATTNTLGRYQNRYQGGDPVPGSVGQVVNYAYRYIDTKYGLSTAWFYGNSIIAEAP